MRSLLLCSILLTLLCAPPCVAQQRVLDGRAIVTQEGMLTIRGGGDASALQLYSAAGAYNGTVLFGADIHDVAPLNTTPHSSLILAAENGRLGLYRYGASPLTPTDAERIWTSAFPPPGKLLGTLRDTAGTAKLYGMMSDSGCAVVDEKGAVRWSRHVPLLNAVAVENGGAIVTLERDGAILGLHRFDAGTGAELARIDLRIAASGSVVSGLLRTGARPVIAVAGTAPRDTALAFDALTLAPQGGAALYGMPIGVVAGVREGIVLPLCITATGSGIRGIWIEDGGGSVATLDWPFASPALRTVEFEGAIAVASHDSAALYSRTLDPLGTLPAPRGLSRVERLANGELLLVGDENSTIVPLPVPPTWFERYWVQGVIAAILLIALVAVVAAIRRDRYTRTLHDNLVRLPDAFGVVTVDTRRRMRSINTTARRLLGTPDGLPLGIDIRTAIGDAVAPLLLPHLRTLIEEGTPFVERFELYGEEPLVVMVRGRALVRRGGGTAGVLLLVEDVTESVRRENLVNWASVAHHIAHEMKTPLGAVAITAETLHERLRETGIEGDMLRATRRILRQAGRLRGIVSDLLTIARADSLRPVDADLALLLGSIVDDLGESIPPSVTLALRTEGTNFRLPLDVEQMSSALRNLLDNAWQAIGPRDDGRVDILLREEKEMLTITVSDNGIGMTPETQTNLFRPFYTLKHGGSGIGTVIIKRVIEGHGGTIGVESTPGHGTRFTVTLPRRG